jgi:hypothetical protein
MKRLLWLLFCFVAFALISLPVAAQEDRGVPIVKAPYHVGPYHFHTLCERRTPYAQGLECRADAVPQHLLHLQLAATERFHPGNTRNRLCAGHGQ